MCIFLKKEHDPGVQIKSNIVNTELAGAVGIHSTLQRYFPTVDKLLTFCSSFVLNWHLLRKCSMASVLTACVNTSYNKL